MRRCATECLFDRRLLRPRDLSTLLLRSVIDQNRSCLSRRDVPRRQKPLTLGRSRRHRPSVELRRRRDQEEARARETQAAQASAAAKAAWEHRQRRKVLAWVFFALAPIVIVTHMLEHVGVFQLYSAGLEDLTIGYPTALLLLIAGGMVYPAD